MDLQQKIMDCFIGKVVRKDLAFLVKGGLPVPTYVLEYLDRMHLYNPGWEIKMLKKNSFSKGYGLITDYIAAVLHEKFSRFSLSRCSQKNRRCKAFNVSITKTEE